MHPDTARQGQLLYLSLGFLGLDLPAAAMPALHAYLDSWRGIGLVERGLERQGRDLSLTRYGDRWGATIFVTGKEHAIVQGSRLNGGAVDNPLDASESLAQFTNCELP